MSNKMLCKNSSATLDTTDIFLMKMWQECHIRSETWMFYFKLKFCDLNWLHVIIIFKKSIKPVAPIKGHLVSLNYFSGRIVRYKKNCIYINWMYLEINVSIFRLILLEMVTYLLINCFLLNICNQFSMPYGSKYYTKAYMAHLVYHQKLLI